MSGNNKFSELDTTNLIKDLLSTAADMNQKQAESAADFLKHLQFDARGIPMKEHSWVVREMLIDARMERWNEGRLIELRSILHSYLKTLGTVSKPLWDQIQEEQDVEKLKKWIRIAIHSKSVETFTNKMKRCFGESHNLIPPTLI